MDFMAIFRNSGLTIVLLALFLLTLLGQLLSGWKDFNDDQREHGLSKVSLAAYAGRGHFWQAVAENWESEFLQMSMFVVLTACLYQKGSPESNDPDKKDDRKDPSDASRTDPKSPWPLRRGGVWLWLYAHSLSIAFGSMFLVSFLMHAVAGHREYIRDQTLNHQPRPSLGDYVTSGKFWFESMQNWQSEFLSLAAMVYGSVYLRERGSAESKRIDSPHSAHE
jgi:hypothetical protein